MDWESKMNEWLCYQQLDSELRNQLISIQDNKLLEESFSKDLQFGTGGLRGEIGPGTNRMNIYTVRKAAKGLANYILTKGEDKKERGVVIAYDSRHKSSRFALEAAKTIGNVNINVYLFDQLRSTPELSFAVRYLNAYAGIVITASHNPAEYNGFKVYGEDGGQIVPDVAKEITNYINSVDNELTVEVSAEEELISRGLLKYLGDEISEVYLKKIKTIPLNRSLVNRESKNLKIVYTPLHGTGAKPVMSALQQLGYEKLMVVKEQQEPDPNFSTVSSPNPEDLDAFTIAIQYGKEVDADILLATDPDTDRLGVAVKNDKGEYVILTGNQLGAIMLQYILEQRKVQNRLPDNGAIIKTIVTSDLGRAIAQEYDIETFDTLTGFKYIGEKIKHFEENESYKFLFGYEESYGYLISDFVRDKDAIQASILVAEVATFYKLNGQTLYDVLHGLYKKYGYYKESLISLTFKGIDGSKQIQAILEELRKNPPTEVNGVKVSIMEDYYSREKRNVLTNITTPLTLPKENVIKFHLVDNSWFAIRPSGTEPKVKFYFSVIGSTNRDSEEKLKGLEIRLRD